MCILLYVNYTTVRLLLKKKKWSLNNRNLGKKNNSNRIFYLFNSHNASLLLAVPTVDHLGACKPTAINACRANSPLRPQPEVHGARQHPGLHTTNYNHHF